MSHPSGEVPWADLTYPVPMRATKAIPICGALGLTFGFLLVILGVSVRDSVLLAAAIMIQGASGAYLWFLLRRTQVSFVELVGMGLVIGTVLSLLSGVVFRPVFPALLAWSLPAIVITLVALGNEIRGRGIYPIQLNSALFLKGSLVAVFGVVVGLGFLTLNLQRYPLQWSGVWDQYHRDLVFFEGLSIGVARFGANDSIFMLDADIRYHWFTYAWSGQLTNSLGVDSFVTLTRVLPLVALVIAVTLVISLVHQIMRVSSTSLVNAKFGTFIPLIGVFLVVTGGYVGAVNGTVLNFDSPSQALSAAWLMGFVLILLLYLDSRERAVPLLLLVTALAGVLTGAKISTGAVAIGSIGVAAVIGLLLKAPWARRAWIATGVSAGAGGLVYLWIVAGSASPGDLRVFSQLARASTLQGLDSSATLRGVVLGTVALSLALSARWVGGIWLVADKARRVRPEPWLTVGLVSVSLIPLWIFSQGLNETWFALAASGPLAAFSAVGLWTGWQRIKATRWTITASVIAAGISIVVVSYVWTDQVWESGFGRFYAPYLGYALALGFGLFIMIFQVHKGLVTALVIASTVIVLQASVARSVPILGEFFGGARDGAASSTTELVGFPVSDIAEAVSPQDTTTPTVPTEGDVLEAIRIKNNDPFERFSWSESEVQAASFLKANAADTDVILTNETLSYLVPALTGLRTYISGAAYQVTYGSPVFAEEVPARVAATRSFITQPDKERAALFSALGIRWIWVSKELNSNVDWTGIGEVAYENEGVVIVQL